MPKKYEWSKNNNLVSSCHCEVIAVIIITTLILKLAH